MLDYGSGNLHSAARALHVAGADVVLTADLGQLGRCSGLVVPGVGAFGACMDGLEALGSTEFIRAWASSGKPLLGICVGHQVMFDHGTETQPTRAGIGLFEGGITRLPVRRCPHMGWNQVDAHPESRLFRGLGRAWFYFVHSYACLEPVPSARSSHAEHEGVQFVAAVEQDNVATTQFHPEKSGAAGALLLRNWLLTLG